MKEEDRLAAVIADIDHDVKIVPRGAFAQSPNGQIYENRSFGGMETLLLYQDVCSSWNSWKYPGI